MSINFRAFVAAGALALAATTAHSATVVSQELTIAELNAITSTANPLFNTTGGGVLENVTGNVQGLRRSPFAGSTQVDDALYTSVGRNSFGIYTFDVVQRGFSMIWGSPDGYNSLLLFLAGDLIETFTPGITDPDATQRGAFSFEVSGVKFDELKFMSGNNAFEFANFKTAPIPLPAGVVLLLTALGGLGVARRMTKAKTA